MVLRRFLERLVDFDAERSQSSAELALQVGLVVEEERDGRHRWLSSRLGL
jgi:hypothetical protein